MGYCEKGYKIKMNKTTTSSPDGSLGSYRYITYFNYLFFSPVLKLKFEKEKFLTYFLLGPRIDREVLNKTILDNLSYSNNNTRKTIFGVTTGGGVEYKLKLLSLNTEVLYFSDISKLEVGRNNFWLKNKCFAINLGATYFFNSNK